MREIIVAIGVMLVLGGCSTTTTAPSDALPIQPERVFAYGAKVSDADSHIIVTRDDGKIGSGCLTGFFINGKLAAKFEIKERADFYLPSGDYILGYGFVEGKGLCAFSWGMGRRDRETILRSGETKLFRLFMDQDANVDILPMSQR